MELLPGKTFATKKIDFFQLPFCLQPHYLKLYPDVEVLEHNNLYATVTRARHKSFKTIRFLFPPVSLSGENADSETEKEFCEAALAFIKEKKLAHRILQPANYCIFKTVPAGSVSVPFGSYRISLKNPAEDLLKNMQARYRSAINQASGLSIEIRSGKNELKPFQALHEETMKRTNAYHETYDSLEKELNALPDNSLLSTVYIDNQLQGGLFVLYSGYSAYYMHGASANTTAASGAIKYLHYKTMCSLQEKGVQDYDFVGARLTDISGTKYEGIQNFKKRFGSELIKGHLWKYDIDPKACKSFDLLLKLKCRLKGTKLPVDIIDQEKKKTVLL